MNTHTTEPSAKWKWTCRKCRRTGMLDKEPVLLAQPNQANPTVFSINCPTLGCKYLYHAEQVEVPNDLG